MLQQVSSSEILLRGEGVMINAARPPEKPWQSVVEKRWARVSRVSTGMVGNGAAHMYGGFSYSIKPT